MSGSIQFSEKCVCGAVITLSENFSLTPTGEIKTRFEKWQRKHENCLPLFQQVQQVRARQLMGPDYKLLGATNGKIKFP